MSSSPPSAAATTYDIVWDHGALGLLFTPNGDEEPVICQIIKDQVPADALPNVKVGDVVVAVQCQDRAFDSVGPIEHLVEILSTEELPVTLRVVSRANDLPERIDSRDVAYSYTFTWPPNQSLGVSLAMDPCTLHTVITAVDDARCAPEFLRKQPEIGDMLVRVSGDHGVIRFDHLRFDEAVQQLRVCPRPCQLAFVRMQQDWGTSRTRQDSNTNASVAVNAVGAGEAPPSSTSSSSSSSLGPSAAPGLNPRPLRPTHLPPPMMHRESIRINRNRNQDETEQTPARNNKDRFYTIEYSGGAIGLMVKDAGRHGRQKKNGYYMVVKEVTDPTAVPGLDQACRGDELIAIGRKDLKNRSFDDVQHELAQIRTPTPLVFQHRRSNGSDVSITSTLIDALLFAFI